MLLLNSCLAYTQSTQTFENATFPPANWTNGGSIRTSNNSCGGTWSCAFNGAGDFIVTPLLIAPGSISFDYRRSSNTAAWSMDIDHGPTSTGPWTNVGSLSSATTTCQNASFAIPNNVYVRLIDTRASGAPERYIDNVSVADGSLPIELSGFIASPQSNSIQLNFTTETERDNDHFSIERSGNGIQYTEIGQVKGAGTSYEPRNYTFTDERPLQGRNYYRLRQVDFDGQFSFSPVVLTQFGKANPMTLAPLPATETLNIQLDKALKADGDWQIFDMNGRLMLAGAMLAETNEQAIPIYTLPAGGYVLRLVVGQEVMVESFRKND